MSEGSSGWLFKWVGGQVGGEPSRCVAQVCMCVALVCVCVWPKCVYVCGLSVCRGQVGRWSSGWVVK